MKSDAWRWNMDDYLNLIEAGKFLLARQVAVLLGSHTSHFDGKVIVSKHTDADGRLVNPRREGTHGHCSYAIVLHSPDNRISYEEYKFKGGRNNDLQWDLDRGHLEIVDG